MADVTELVGRLGNKIGPLPVWLWAAIPAGAYVVYSYYKVNQGADEIIDSTIPGVVDEFDSGYPSLPGYNNAPDGSPNLPPIDPPEFTNRDWERQAISWLIGQHVSAATAARAVSSYLWGSPARLNTSEYQALERVVSAIGPAPEGGTWPDRPGPGTPPKPKPKPPVNVPEVRGLRMTAERGTGKVVMQWSRLTGNYRYEWNMAGPGEGWKADKITRGVRVSERRKVGEPGKVFTGRVRVVDVKGNRGSWVTATARVTK